jgi:hypothetical protein
MMDRLYELYLRQREGALVSAIVHDVATVLVIDRDAFSQVISADPALVGPLCEIVAQQQAAQEKLRRHQPLAESNAQQMQRLRQRVKPFFHL